MVNRRFILPIIFFTIFLDMLGFGILIPILPQLFANPDSSLYLLGNSVSVETGYVFLGILTAAYPLGQFVATPILGQLSDMYGRKKILAIALLGTLVSYVVFGIGVVIKSVWLLMASRFFDGVTGGNISVAQAVIADSTLPQDRAKNFGLIGAAFGLGFILGPFLGGVLVDSTIVSWFGPTVPFWFAAILSLINVIIVWFVLPETYIPQEKTRLDWGKSLANLARAATFPGFRGIFATNFIYQASFAFFASFFGVFLVDRFMMTEGQIGKHLAFLGICIVLTQVTITRFLATRVSDYKIIRTSLILAGLIMFTHYFVYGIVELRIVAAMFAVANGLVLANINGLISRKADKTIQGEILGINASVQALAQSIPPLISGFVVVTFTPETPVLVAGVLMVVAGLVFVTARYFSTTSESVRV